MPRYHFHLRSRDSLQIDETGVIFASLEEAYLEAPRAVGTIARELTAEDRNPLHYSFEITAADRQLLIDLPFAEVLDRPRRALTGAMTAAQREAIRQKQESARLRQEMAYHRAEVRKTLDMTRELLGALRSEEKALRHGRS